MPTVDEVVRGYIRLRDKKGDLAKKHAEELAPIKAAMDKMEGWLHRNLLKTGVDSMKTKEGTAFLKMTSSASVRDRDAWLKFVIEHQMWDLIEARTCKTVVMDYLESTGEVVPGVEVQQVQVVQVRR